MARARQLRRIRQRLGDGQGLIAHVLDAALVEDGRGGRWRVVVELLSGEGEVVAGIAGGLGHREVGGIGKILIDFAHQGESVCVLHGAGEGGDGGAVLSTGLEHGHPPATSPRLHVHDHADVLQERVLAGEESPGAEQPYLLPIGDEHDHIALVRACDLQGAHGLQSGDHPCRIVGRAWRARHRIGVGHQHDAGHSRVRARQYTDQVFDNAARGVAPPNARRRLSCLGRHAPGIEAQGGHPLENIVSGGEGRRGSFGMGDARDHPVVHHGAGSGKSLWRRIGGLRRRGSRGKNRRRHARHDAEGQKE